MDRRRFLRDLLCAATTAALAPAVLHGEHAVAGDPAAFAAGLKERPWLAGWQQVSAEALGPAQATIEGRLPEELAGTLYRNGPAWFERDGFRYEHWFDGDGMVHGWTLGNGRVGHAARMVDTPKFRRERKAGRFNTLAAGTSVPNVEPVRNNDDANTANTSVTVVNGRLFALCEAGSAFELHPDTLQTLGPVTWRDDLAALPFSAHPLHDRDGSVWNFGALAVIGGAQLLVWHIGADGGFRGAYPIAMPEPGYLHAFTMTDRHLVFVTTPFDYTPAGSFFESLTFAPQRGCRIAVVEKANPGEARWFEADFAMCYHFGDAFERDGRIVVRAVQHLDVEDARSPMRAAMRGHGAVTPTRARLAELHIDLRRGGTRWEVLPFDGMEFPMFDARTPGDRGARLYAPVIEGRPTAPSFNAVAAFDLVRGRREVFSYGADVLAEEHVFVPRPGSTRVDDGWLLGTVLDPVRQRSGLAVLDARHVADGPVAMAWLPYRFPLGFHGYFSAAA